MRVRRLEINGFKSFADKTTVDFPQGMCAVVGPNGCGKSNVVDSIRWVLGEQSAKQLRGHAREDVIFNGSTGRKPLGAAEVSLVFENNGSISHQRFASLAEIMISRRLYRSGESEYLINKMPCRLKDIQQLLMDTGLGNRSYAIIEQGRVAAFVEARPEERRLWVEEAAGITRYKNQKKVSLRKMESAQENMNRLMDIMVEVETQMKRLERQAKKAQTYKELKEQIRDLDLNLASTNFLRLQEELDQLNEEMKAKGTSLLLANQKVTAQETDLETLKIRLIGAEQEINDAGQRKLKAEGEIQKAENELTLLSREAENQRRMRFRFAEEAETLKVRLRQEEKELLLANTIMDKAEDRLTSAKEKAQQATTKAATYRERLKVMENRVDQCKQALVEHLSEATQAKNRLTDLEKSQSDLLRRRESLAGRKENLSKEIQNFKEKYQALEQEKQSHQDLLNETEHTARALEEERRVFQTMAKEAGRTEEKATRKRHEHQAAYDALQMAVKSYDWVQKGVQKLLKAAEKNHLPVDILGLLADGLIVEPGRESLVETALGNDLAAVLVKTGDDLVELAHWAQKAQIGQLKILALEDLNKRNLSAPKNTTPLREICRPKPGFEGLAVVLAGIGWQKDLEDAYYESKDLQLGQRIITSSGHKIDQPGSTMVGQDQKQNSILAKQNQLEERKQQLKQAEEEEQEAKDRRRHAQDRLNSLEDQAQDLRSRQKEQERAATKFEQEIFRIKEAGLLKNRELEGVDYHFQELSQDYEKVLEEQAIWSERLEDSQAKKTGLEEDLTLAKDELEYGREEIETIRQEENQAQLSMAKVATEAEHAAKEADRLEQAVSQDTNRLSSLEQDIDKASQTMDGFAQRREQEQTRLGALYQDLEEQTQAHTQARELHSQAQMQVADMDSSLKQAREEQRKVQSQNQDLDLLQKEMFMQKENLCQQIMERCRVDLASDHETYLPEKGFDPETSKTRLEKLRKRLTNLGAVNLEAISEHQALSERHHFLFSQKEDLDESLADLRQAIRKINKTSRQRFKETLEKVNSRLAEIYPVLFSGGQAQLITDPDADPLEAGLHLLVELPGKKVKNLEALSGGEKALSAVAVLFALFLIKPAPFCILDEVDAPLDEANVGRFHDLVQKLSNKSQIIMITHSRRTMEIMDQLYGVTMEEKGVSKVLSVNLAQGESMAA